MITMQKKKLLTTIFLTLLLMNLVLATSVQAYTVTTRTEDFQDEVDGTNPNGGDGWYGYGEFGYGDNANSSQACNTTADASSYVYYINASTTAPTAGYANFTMNTSKAYTSFTFDIKYINDWANWQNHSGVIFYLSGENQDYFAGYLYGANASATGDRNTLVIVSDDGAKRINLSITEDTWYTIKLVLYQYANQATLTVYSS